MNNQELIGVKSEAKDSAALEALELRLYDQYDKRIKEIRDFFVDKLELFLNDKGVWNHIAKAIVTYAIEDGKPEPERTRDEEIEHLNAKIKKLEARNMRLEAENSNLHDETEILRDLLAKK